MDWSTKLLFLLVGSILALTTFNGCVTSDVLFQHPEGQAIPVFEPKPFEELVIQSGDKITISVWGFEDLSIGSVNSSFSSGDATGKWLIVDKLGEINLPRIGRIKITGYNLKEANYVLEKMYEQSGIKDPIINIRILNHYITVLGEVNAPGKYKIDNENIDLIQLLGDAKGLTKYAKTAEVKLIRKVGTQNKEVIINLSDAAMLNGQNYQLKSNDIIYIPPKKSKRFDEMAQQATPIAGILTSIAVLFSVFLK